jgi:hypothetical protein
MEAVHSFETSVYAALHPRRYSLHIPQDLKDLFCVFPGQHSRVLPRKPTYGLPDFATQLKDQYMINRAPEGSLVVDIIKNKNASWFMPSDLLRSSVRRTESMRRLKLTGSIF